MALFQRFQRNEQMAKIVRDAPVAANDEGGFVQLIVGLGNVGKKYEKNRHNVGFMVVDKYREEKGFPDWQEKTKFKAYVSEDFADGKKVVLVKPTTLMNLSGESVRALKDFYKVSNNDITIIHDELDLPLGTVKIKKGGGSAGHNGLKSLIKHIGEDFSRIRLGVKNDQLEQIDSADFVLANFSGAEKKQLGEIIQTALNM
jgi:PTH1 family peptidyl-tRNA hydrolase